MQVELKNKRIISIDFMRGLTVAFMIFVNSPGSWNHVLPCFTHAPWNGCTFADLVFPFFLFIVGLSIFFSSVSAKEISSGPPLFKFIKRTVLLFLIGLLINGFPFYQLSTLRIPGVLQRISIVYLACAILNRYASRFFQFMLMLGILVGYWLLMSFVKPPGVAGTSLTPADNLSAWVDAQVFKNHVWAQTKPWDPEGLLGSFPAIATGIIGMLTAEMLQRIREKRVPLYALPITGLLLVIAGIGWNLSFPINKNLWTSSYVLFTGGIAQLFLAAIYWLIDEKGHRKFTIPFLAFGSNAILAYILSELLEASWSNIFLEENYPVKSWVFEHFFANWLPPLTASHVMATVFVMVIYLPVYWMYKRRLLLKIG